MEPYHLMCKNKSILMMGQISPLNTNYEHFNEDTYTFKIVLYFETRAGHPLDITHPSMTRKA